MKKAYYITIGIYEGEKVFFINSSKTNKKLVCFPMYQKDQMQAFFNKLINNN